MPHPWKHSRPSWTGLWATWSGWRCPCLLQEGWARWPLKVPSNPKRSMICGSEGSWCPAMGCGRAGSSHVERVHHSWGSCSPKLLLPRKAEVLLWDLPSDDTGAGFTCLFYGEASVIACLWVPLWHTLAQAPGGQVMYEPWSGQSSPASCKFSVVMKEVKGRALCSHWCKTSQLQLFFIL